MNSKGSCMADMRGWFGRIGKDDTPGVHPKLQDLVNFSLQTSNMLTE